MHCSDFFCSCITICFFFSIKKKQPSSTSMYLQHIGPSHPVLGEVPLLDALV